MDTNNTILQVQYLTICIRIAVNVCIKFHKLFLLFGSY